MEEKNRNPILNILRWVLAGIAVAFAVAATLTAAVLLILYFKAVSTGEPKPYRPDPIDWVELEKSIPKGCDEPQSDTIASGNAI